MKFRSRRPLFAALAALFVLPVAALGIWALATGTAQAGGDDDTRHVYSFVQLALGGEGPFLGVHLTEETDLDEGGARVTQVIPNSAADTAGVEVGDVIVEFDGVIVRGPMSLSDRIDGREVGDRVQFTVIRDGRERRIDAELGEHKSAFRVLGLNSLEDFDCDDDCGDARWRLAGLGNRPLLGVQLVEMTQELRDHMGSAADEGVLVSRVITDSAAEDGGIEVGDVIVSVDGDRIGDVNDLRSALSRLAGERFNVDVVRDGRTTSLGVTLPEAEEFDHSSMRWPVALDPDVLNRVRAALDQARESRNSI